MQFEWNPSTIFDNLILVGGPPRSGTTLLAKILNHHTHIATAIDNTVYESWGLYYYRYRTGLCNNLRHEQLTAKQIQKVLMDHISKDSYIIGVASSESVLKHPYTKRQKQLRHNPLFLLKMLTSPKAILKQLHNKSLENELDRRRNVPYKSFQNDLRLSLKSPEIVFFLDVFEQVFPKAQFVLVFRPIIEVAESMYRKGFEWKLASYHRRWNNERDKDGNLVPPPEIPVMWHNLWGKASDFQRCVIYAVSFLRSLVLNLEKINNSRYFLYYHPDIVSSPKQVLSAMANFLGEDFHGFESSLNSIISQKQDIKKDLIIQYDEISDNLRIEIWESKAHALAFH